MRIALYLIEKFNKIKHQRSLMKNWKRILALLLCLSLLAGCAGNKPHTEPGQQETIPASESGTEQSAGQSTEPATAQNPDQTAEPVTTPSPDQTTVPTTDPSGGTDGPGPVSLTEEYHDNFISVRDADPGMTISVLAPVSYSREQVLAGIKFSNLSNPFLTDPDEKDLIDPDCLLAEGGNGEFKVSCADGFNRGEVYQLELTDELLSYQGHDSAVRYYNLITTAEEANRMRLKPSIKYQDMAALLPEEASAALQFDGVFRFGHTPANGEPASGTFSGREGDYYIGDLVAIYQDTPPDDRTFDDSDLSVAYVRITGFTEGPADQMYYHYVGASQKDVVFIPDIIPIQEQHLISRGADNKVTLPAADLVFSSNGVFAGMGLNESTEVEPGDFVAFYTGSEESGTVTGYAEVVSVTWSDETADGEDTVQIEYRETDLETIKASLDVYREFTLSDEQIAAAYDEDALKAAVIEEMTNNGFLIQSSWSLAQIAMENEEIKAYFGDTPLEELTFFYGEDESVSVSGQDFLDAGNGGNAIDVDVKSEDPDIRLSPNIVHFAGKTGYGAGYRLEINVKFRITIKDTDDPKRALKTTITFFFEAEAVFGCTLDATSVWKWFGFIPYLYDYIISGSVSTGIYIGSAIAAQATLVKYEPDKTEEEKAAGIEWPEDVKRSPGAERVLKCANTVKDLGRKHADMFPEQTTGGGTLPEKYRAFTKGSEKAWTDLVNKNIFDFRGTFDTHHITAFQIKGDFIVGGLLNAAAGVAGNYERSHRQIFSFALIHEKTSAFKCDETNVSDLRADFYIFGAAGLRAGLRLTVAGGLFDTRLDSVGLEVEGGLYTRFWGFFYAGLEAHNAGREGTSTDAFYEGGLLIEAGSYYSVTWFAQAGDGAISYRKLIESGEKPIFSAGADTVITDFSYQDGEKAFDAVFPVNERMARIPDSVFLMKGMSLKSSAVAEVSRADRDASELYDITFSDPAYSYRFENGAGYLCRNSDEGGRGTVTMTLKWRGSSFEQMSHDLERTVDISWIANQTTMQFLDRDGSVFFAVSKIAGEPLEAGDLPGRPANPGYVFRGWVNPDGTDLEEMPTVMPRTDTVYTSKWERVTVPVTVEYYITYRSADGKRDDYISGYTDVIPGLFYPGDKVTDITAVLKEHHLLATEPDYNFEGKNPYEHYRVNEETSELSCDYVQDTGSTIFRLRLVWVANTIRFDDGAGNIITRQFVPGMTIEFPSVTRQGYDFVGWQNEAGEMISWDNLPVSTRDETYTAIWKIIPPTFTLVFQIVKRGRGTMPFYYETVETRTLTWDSYEVTVRQLIALKDMSGYTYSDTYSGRGIDDIVTISPDGTTVVNLRFK